MCTTLQVHVLVLPTLSIVVIKGGSVLVLIQLPVGNYFGLMCRSTKESVELILMTTIPDFINVSHFFLTH